MTAPDVARSQSAPGAYPPPRPRAMPLQLTGEYDGTTGHWWHLSTGSSVKYSAAAHAYICLAHDCIAARRTADCEHVDFVRALDEQHRDAEPTPAADDLAGSGGTP